MKKIDKRACRKFDTQKLRIRSSHGLLHAPGVSYIVRTTVRGIGGKRLLVLCYFAVADILAGKETPKYVTFQSKDDYISLEHLENVKTKWRQSQTIWLDNTSPNMNERSAFYSGIDEEKVINFCGKQDQSGFICLQIRQEQLKQKRQHERWVTEQERLRKQMQPIDSRPLPKDLMPWLEHTYIPAHIFYEYRKGKKVHNGYCTRCKQDVLVESPRHSKQGICPNCKTEVTFHAIGRHSRVMESDTAQVVQRIGAFLAIRIVKIYVHYTDPRNPHMSLWESARYLCGVHRGKYIEKEYHWSSKRSEITGWNKGKRTVYNRYYYDFAADNCAYLYPGNLTRALKDTPWQYCQVKAFSEHFQCRMTLNTYLSAYYEKPVLEYLVKLKLFMLAKELAYGVDRRTFYHRDAVNSRGKCLQDVLGVGKEYLPMLQHMGIDSDCLYLLQKLSARISPVEEWFLQWCMDSKINDDQDILRCLRYGSPHKLKRYITEQIENLQGYDTEEVFHLYKDYIRFCETLDYDLTDDFILYPRNVKEAHDNTSILYDEKKMCIFNEQIAAAYPALCQKYEMADKGLRMVPPKSADEIVAEGQALHHCVGSYVDLVANRESIILFLRKEEQPDTPFYTVEVKNGNVAQVRGNNNCRSTQEVNAYMELWKQKKLLPAMQEAA